ncbi:MAG: hypothetical protein JOZ78_19355 [Chroococcidiopsidaceae cyanobacterium CP_BM_ER_R8_30]|nr:hypothetical protein [Chroococcidiopsidaceae cyanobacterium CP_BM_ER_R8_30]
MNKKQLSRRAIAHSTDTLIQGFIRLRWKAALLEAEVEKGLSPNYRGRYKHVFQ